MTTTNEPKTNETVTLEAFRTRLYTEVVELLKLGKPMIVASVGEEAQNETTWRPRLTAFGRVLYSHLEELQALDKLADLHSIEADSSPAPMGRFSYTTLLEPAQNRESLEGATYTLHSSLYGLRCKAQDVGADPPDGISYAELGQAFLDETFVGLALAINKAEIHGLIPAGQEPLTLRSPE